MRKSEQYQAAALAVLDHELISPLAKVEIIATLMSDRNMALYTEEPKVVYEEAATK